MTVRFLPSQSCASNCGGFPPQPCPGPDSCVAVRRSRASVGRPRTMFVQDACHEGPRVRWARGFRSHLIHPAQPVFGPARSPRIGIAPYSGKVNADSGRSRRCCPLTSLLCFIEAIEVAFPRHAPWILLSVNGLRGQTSRNNHTQCDSRKR